jgi:hypothetical protein
MVGMHIRSLKKVYLKNFKEKHYFGEILDLKGFEVM